MSTHVFHRSLQADLPYAIAGEGVYLIDAEGKDYLDASGGAAVSCLGHSHERVRAAIHEQVDKLAFAHTGFFTNEPSEKLADFLVAQAPGEMAAVYFVSGGSEAVESALKMARQYCLEIDQPERVHFIARRQSYHGNTLGALSVGGNRWRKKPFEPLLVDHPRVSPCYPYRDQRKGESEAEYAARLVDELKTEIERLGGDKIIAFVAETVCGATLGAQPAVKGYFREIRKLCDEHGILLILDEVMCGMGRTGSLFAYEQEDIVPDIVTIAKGLGAGYQPIGAAIVSSKVYEAFVNGSKTFLNGHTYLGHPVACAAALAVQQTIEDENLLANVRAMGGYFAEKLCMTFGSHPNVGDIRGRGLFWAMEFVADASSKAPFSPDLKIHARIKQAAMKEGLVCYPNGGTIDGRSGDHVLLAPPFISDETVLDELVARLSRSLERGFDGVA